MICQSDRTTLLDQLDVLLSKTVNLFTRSLAEVVRGKISIPQFIVLKILHDFGRSSVSQMAAKLGITLSAVTSLGDGLVRASLVERVRDEKDRRVVWLQITAKGIELVRELERRRREEMERLASRLSPEQLEELVHILGRLVATGGR
ncbi:MAG TPA: MarR family transcriptional regulator [Firmicutes bacterium]|nr:MarR family transcriptional regulator [Candidatus Fermentithermobacillaceae bacterium]